MPTHTRHKHHIIPRHAGGTDCPDNLISLSVADHAEAHRILWEKYGKREDFIAWRGLSGRISKIEIEREKCELSREKIRSFYRENDILWWNNGVKSVRRKDCPGEGWVEGRIFRVSEENKRKMSDKMKQSKWWNDGTKNKRTETCPGEGWVLGKLGNNGRGAGWWNNGTDHKRSAECPGEGWVRGVTAERASAIGTTLAKSTAGYKMWNDGKTVARAVECPGEGWVRGVGTFRDYHWWNNGIKQTQSAECPGEGWVRGVLPETAEKYRKLLRNAKTK